MTFGEFISLVSDMRQAQTNYFASRDQAILRLAKALERQVDSAIEAFQRGVNPLPAQPDLFD